MSLVLGIILIGAIILRLVSLGQSYWLDEAVGVWASRLPLKVFFRKYLPGDFHPPLYYLLEHFWLKIFPPLQEPLVRLLSVGLGIFSLYLFWLIAKEQRKGEFSWWAVVLLASSPLHLYYSQEARPYILALTTTLLAFWFFWRFVKSPNWKNAFCLGGSFLLMGFSHYLTWFLFPVFFFWGWGKVKKKDRWIFLCPFLIFLLGFSFFLPVFFRQLFLGRNLRTIYPGWARIIGSLTLKSLFLLPVKFIIGRVSFQNKIIYWLTGGILTLLGWGMVGKAAFAVWQKEEKKGLTSLIVSCLFLPLLLGILVSLFIPIFSYFRFFFLLPFFYLLLLEGIWLSRKRKEWLIFWLVVNLFFSFFYLSNSRFHRENWRRAVFWLKEKNRGVDAPVMILPQVSKAFELYNQGEMEVVYLSPQKPESFLGRIKKEEVVWLIPYGLPIFDGEGKIKEILGKRYQVKKKVVFRGVEIEKLVKIK